MRLRSILVVGICLVATVGRGETNYGVKAGACSVDRSYSYLEYMQGPVTFEQSRAGMCVGLFGHWAGSQPLSLLAEVQYVQKGIAGAEGRPVDCLCLPAMARWDMRAGHGHLYAAMGPRVDIYLDSKYESHATDFERVDFGVDVALGYELGRVLLETRYSGAFTAPAVPGGGESSVEVLQLQLGWTFWSGGESSDVGVSEPPN